jgi:general secretion pathway protein D
MADKGYLPLGRFKTGGFTALGSPPVPPQQNINFKPTFYPPAQTSAGQESPFTYAIFDDNINIVLRTLASALDTNLLSAPKITTVNNREAEIKVTQKLPWAEPSVSVEGTSGTITVTWAINFEEVGIILKVTPIINEEGNIIMTLSPEVSEKTADYTLTVTQGTTSVPYTVPIIDKRSTSTKVVVGDGQTLIIGGMIKDKTTKGETKIPLLGDIPYLGYLFKSKKDIYDKTELLIFVSPKVITPNEYVYMARQEKYVTEKGYQKERQRKKERAIKEQEQLKRQLEAKQAAR